MQPSMNMRGAENRYLLVVGSLEVIFLPFFILMCACVPNPIIIIIYAPFLNSIKLIKNVKRFFNFYHRRGGQFLS